MASNEAWSEIRPLDDASDIARSAEVQPGETLANSRNWAGFGTLSFGIVAAIAAVVAVTAGWGNGGLVLGILAALAVLTGAGLLVAMGRRRARAPAQFGYVVRDDHQVAVRDDHPLSGGPSDASLSSGHPPARPNPST